MSDIPFIVYEHGGVPDQLFGESDWRAAIAAGKITRETMVGVFRAGAGRVDIPAGQVPELRGIFAHFETGAPIAPEHSASPYHPRPHAGPPGYAGSHYPPGQPPAYAPPRPPGGTPWVWIGITITVIIVLITVLAFVLVGRSGAPVDSASGNNAQQAANGNGGSSQEQAPADSGEPPTNQVEPIGAYVTDVRFGTEVRDNVVLNESISPPPGPTTLVAKLYYSGAVPPGRFACRLSGAPDIVGDVDYASGSIWCRWTNISPGNYRLALAIDGNEAGSRNISVPMATGTPSPSTGALDSRARSVIQTYYAQWAPSNDVSWIYRAYSGSVRYFDKSWSRQMIADGQVQTINRFPYRSYSPSGMDVSCDDVARSCRVTGTVTYDWSNGATGERRSDTKRFEFMVREEGGAMVIVSERWLS